jgi:hypothetical protein
MPSNELLALEAVSPFITAAPATLMLLAGVFKTWAPKLYKYYETKLGQLYARTPSLEVNFKNSIWTAATFNFGPQTVAFKHRDSANLAFGLCAITALGQFDSKRGGHLILWDMELVIEFPPGATILIPSALLTHSNAPVQPGEVRMSLTQYCAGGLFRWVDQGFQTAGDFEAADKKGKERFDQKAKERWQMGIDLFSTLSELKALMGSV